MQIKKQIFKKIWRVMFVVAMLTLSFSTISVASSTLHTAIELAESKVQSAYTTESWLTLQRVLHHAKMALANKKESKRTTIEA